MTSLKEPVPSAQRLLPLEALRGMAAVVVVFYHFALTFFPRNAGIFTPEGLIRSHKTLMGTPLFVFMNGIAMVTIFFTLSGYVLSRKGLRPFPKTENANAAIKRWFRLAPLVFASTCISYVFFRTGLYHYQAAAALNGADFMTHRVYEHLPEDYHPPFWATLYQGAIGTFLGDYPLNGVLWTMPWELYGSLLIFALSLLLQGDRFWLWTALPLCGLLFMNSWCVWLFPFLGGILGTALRIEILTCNTLTVTLALCMGLYLCGYIMPVGWYAWVGMLPVPKELALSVVIQSIGGFLLLCVFASDNAVSNLFNGSVSRILGKISFPLYLVHQLIIGSFCCYAYVWYAGGGTGAAAAAAAFICAAFPLIWLLARFDIWWLRTLAGWQPVRPPLSASPVAPDSGRSGQSQN